jgi:hypothetical protein
MFNNINYQNIIFDNNLLLYIFDYGKPYEIYNLILSCKVIHNLLNEKVNKFKIIINLHKYILLELKSVLHDKYIYNIFPLKSYIKTKFYYQKFFLSSFPRKESIKKIRNKMKEFNQKYKLKHKMLIRVWNDNNNLNVICFNKKFSIL